MRPLLVTGPPGSGKTTNFVEKLSSETPGTVYIFEPFQEIVNRKSNVNLLDESGNIINSNIKYVNYARGFSFDFLDEIDERDVIVIDEAHTIFFTEYRNFDIKTLSQLVEAFSKNRLIFITATPEILKIYLNNLKIHYDIYEYGQRLKRSTINIRLIPVACHNYLTKNRLLNYDIVCINNIKTLKKMEYGGLADEFTYIYSNYNEQNHFLFEKKMGGIDDKKWAGTGVIAQGIDKNITLAEGIGRVLFDGNSSLEIPDLVKKRYHDVKNTEYYTVLFKCMAERIVQTDRFRKDLDELNVDILLDMDFNRMDLFKNIIISYFENVYKSCKINFIEDTGLYKGDLGRFTNEIFFKSAETYDPQHTFSHHSLTSRFQALVNYWCSAIRDGERIKKIGHYKNTLSYFKTIYDKFDGIDNDLIFFDNINELRPRLLIFQQSLPKYIDYLVNSNLKEISREYLKIKEWDFGKRPDNIEDQLYLDLDYLGETFLEIHLSHYGIRYNIEDCDNRESSPIQLLPKYLRSLIIVNDIDVSGAHIVAMIKKVMGDNFEVNKEMIDKIYSYNNNKEYILRYLSSYKRLEGLDIEKELKTERGICKNAILWAVNKLKYGRDVDYEYVKKIIGEVIDRFNHIDLKEYGELGYYNGVEYENKWLKEYNTKRGVIFRIADGLCQVYGNIEILNEIREEIMNTYKIPIAYENIAPYNVLGLRTFDSFLQEEAIKNKDLIVTDEMLRDSLYECIDALERFRKYCRKGRYNGKAKGKAKGKAVGKAKGKAKGKAVNIKKYRILEDFVIRSSGKEYRAGEYEWTNIPKEITKSYRVRFLKRT